MSIVFFDLDGTLVDEDGNIPPSAALAIRRLWSGWKRLEASRRKEAEPKMRSS